MSSRCTGDSFSMAPSRHNRISEDEEEAEEASIISPSPKTDRAK